MGAAQLMTANQLSGHWRKDKSQSQIDCYSRSLDLLGLGGIQKRCAEKLINGLQIEEKDGGMRVAYKVDKVPFYKHVEEFRLDQPVTMSRRDKKSGQQHALLKRLPDSVQVEIKLEGPDKGMIRETYSTPREDILQIESTTIVGGKSETCIQVYRRQ